MRAGELLGRPVLDGTGRRVGIVVDLRCVREPAPDPAWGVLRLESLLVNRRQVGGRLGYDRRESLPVLLRVVLRRLHGRSTEVPWSAVASWDRSGVRLRP